uniref:Uncharacterized protein n=1 Tax=Arundo donax TaxID=35708 RepID=A0A0A9B553_ARUDO
MQELQIPTKSNSSISPFNSNAVILLDSTK